MDLSTASQIRLPPAVEISPRNVHFACEVARLGNGKIVWCEDAWLLDLMHSWQPFKSA
jgi:hypothetical protein